MSVEPMLQPAFSVSTRYHAVDLAGLQGDGSSRASDDGRRRVTDVPMFPALATPQICVAAWHGVLHWLRYNDEPVTTCLVGRRAQACWPIVTSVGDETSLAQLLAEVAAQWPLPESPWLDLNDPSHADLLDPLRWHAIRLEEGSEASAPEFALIRDGDMWRVACAESRYSASYQDCLVALWRQFVLAMIEQPQALLSQQVFLAEDAGAGVAGPVVSIDGNLVQRFAACVATMPGKTAVIDEQGSMSFAELDALSTAWAQAMQAAGVKQASHVGLAFGRGQGMVAAQIAVLKAGAVFVPLDASQPVARLQAMADDTDMALLLADAAAAPILQGVLPHVRCLLVDELDRVPGRCENVRTAIGTDDPAYVIFTSGSTGKPKGVKVSHGNLLNFVVHLSEWVGTEDVLSQFAPFTFDASVAEIHTALLNGATLVILSAPLIDDPDQLQTYMREKGVTFAAFPPQYAQHLSPDRLPQLRTLLTAGSAPDRALIARWQPHVRYINAYGPTETTILSTAWHAGRVPGAHEPIVIGTPISNTQIKVVNRFNQSLPHGVIGELLIGGEGVTHGYVKREALTRERFITLDRTRWYRSGDLSCFDSQGQLIFAGRVDSQLKLRGHRLEPGEVEAALLAVEGVRQAAVAAVDAASAKQLVAFCVGSGLPEDELRAALQQLLPAWALPNRIVWLDRLPLTRNGKTDYLALSTTLNELDAQCEQPHALADHADELEARIAAIWGNVLQQRSISREDNFIHLGGDSLTSLVVTSAIRRLGFQATSAQLLANPRLADYARLLSLAGQQSPHERDHASREGPAPLAPIQGWFFSLPLCHPGTFCQSLVFESDERIDVARLMRACAALVRHHDQLRACFKPEAQAKAGWRQEVMPGSMPLPEPYVLDLADSLLDASTEASCQRLAAELRIDVAPLFRMAVIHTPRRSRAIWVLHHLIVDTVSHGILLDDLHQLYMSSDADATQVLPGKGASYGEWSAMLQAQVDDKVKSNPEALLAQWQPVLDGLARSEKLPVAVGGHSGTLSVSRHALAKAGTSRLRHCGERGYRQSPEELVLAATYLAISRTFGLKRVVIDVEWHGRDESMTGGGAVDRTVGWFTSVHPLPMSMPADDDLGRWLMAFKETRAAIPHRGRDFYALRYLGQESMAGEEAAVRSAFVRCPKAQVLFNFSGVVQRTHAAWRSVPVVAIELGEGNASPYPLSVESEMRDGELIIGLYHDSAAWGGGVVERLGQAIVRCLAEVIEHVEEPRHARWTPSDFPGLTLSQAQADRLPLDTVDAFALTDMQETMRRHQDTYQVRMCYRMPRRWNEAAWRQAVTDWTTAHACLRTRMQTWDDGSACQVVLREVMPRLTVHLAAAGTGEKFAQALLRKSHGLPVRLDRAPLFAMDIVDDGGDDFLLLLGIHHLIHDGWSIERMMGDLLQAYCHRCGEAVPLPDAPLASMADIVAQQCRLQGSAEWQAHFACLPWAPTACQLPTLPQRKPESSARTPETKLYHGALPHALVDDVRRAARERGVTVNSLWLTGYVCLLRYLGGQPQVRCGVIQNGRMEEIPGVETITGCCVNTLPLVLDIPGTTTLAELVAAVGGQLDRMRSAAAYPLSLIHEAVRPLIEDEMFSTLFNIESRRYGTDQALRPTLVGGHESTNYSFIFGLIEQDAQAEDGGARIAYDVRIGYDTARFEPAAIARWLSIYAHCMQALVSSPDEAWHRLQLLPKDMWDRAVSTWNDTRRDYPAHRCVHDLFSEQARLNENAPALLYKDAVLSYGELDRRTDALARQLVQRGVRRGAVVGLVAHRSPEMVIAMLAVFKAGAGYVPIDPRYPAGRVRHMMKDVGCTLALCQRRDLASVIPSDLDVALIYLDEPAIAANEGAAVALPQGQHGRDLAYVMYTSGSTGKPKGVMIEHRSIVRLVANSADIAFESDDRILLTSAPGFDVTIWEIWSALLGGLPLVIVDEDTLLEPLAFAAEMRAKRVTTLWLIAPLFNQLVQEMPDLFAGVRLLMIGGDALSAPHVQMARRANPGLRIVNGYGPTENTSFSTYHFVSDADTEVVPIGRPITNATAYVVNGDGQLLPPGVNGELYVGGPGVARGYLHQPELTAAKFVPDPYSSEPDARLYRTGDLVRWREDGLIDFLGRIDHQVKIRGFRIELGEIEALMAKHAQVKQAIVVVKQSAGQKQLVAYLVPKPEARADKQALMASVIAGLRSGLPDYMVPAAFVVLDAMPRNANGKIDRERLPEPDASAHVHGAHEAPANATEHTLWLIWKEVLGTEAFGVTDRFFAIGGDSILSIQVVAKASQQGLTLTPRLIAEAQTIRQLADSLATAPVHAPGQVAELTSKSARDAQGAQGQQRLLPIQLQFLQDPVDVDRYAQYALLPLPAECTPGHVRAALAAMVARHDVLRLKFRETAGGWVAFYQADAQGAMTDKLASCLDMAETDARDIDTHVASMLDQLDIRQGRLFDLRLLNCDGQMHLLWVMHHLVVDAVSWRVLTLDMDMALAQTTRGEPIDLGARPARYQDWAARLHDHAYSTELEAEREYWITQMSLPSARLRSDVGHADAKAAREASTETVEVHLEAEETRGLQNANVRHSTRTHHLVLAAVGRALGRWLDADGLRIDIEGHGREGPANSTLFDAVDVSRTVGWFTTVHPLHLGALRADLGTLIQQTKAGIEATPCHGLGYGVLSLLAQDEALQTDAQTASQVLFNYLGQFDADMAGGSQIGTGRRRTHALRIEAWLRGGALSLRFDHSRDQFSHETIAALAARCIETLREMIGDDADPGNGSESAFCLTDLSREEQAALKARYPGLQDAYPCTGMQQGLLLLAARAPHSGLYLTQLRMALSGADAARLRHSWQVLFERHDVLRTAFVDVGRDTLMQIVATGLPLPWREVDGRALRGDQDALAALLDEERTKPFDMAQAPLMRLLLVQTGDDGHVLSWTHHHALVDGWSIGLLIKELFEVYATPDAVQMATPQLSWRQQVQWLLSRDRAASERYWQRYFEGLDVAASASLPLDHRAGEAVLANTQAQGLETLTLSAEDTANIVRLGRAEGVGLGTLMFAAWGLLLSRHSAEPEVLFGYASSGRSPELPGSDGLVGLCINSLPMRLKIEGDQTLGTWLRQIQSRQFDNEDHGHLPLADIQRCAGAGAGQSLFDSLVVVENYPLDRSILSASANLPRILSIEGVEQNDFALNLAVYPGEQLTFKLAWRPALFEASTATALLRQLAQLLASCAQGGGAQTLSRLSILNDAEQALVRQQWHDADLPYADTSSVPALFEAVARERAAEPAIILHSQTWSYAQLHDRVRHLSAWLATHGTGPGSRVALSLRREPDAVAAMLAVMRLGAAYVPIAIDCPAERRAFMLFDADVSLTLTHRPEQQMLADAHVLYLDDCPAVLQDGAGASIDVDATSTAYIIYTSGTTGMPKGVAISHRNLANFCAWGQHAGWWGEGAAATQFAPLTFDASVGEIFGALLAGGALHLLPDALIQDPRALGQYLCTHDIRFAAFPPSYLQQMDPDVVPANLTLLTAGSAPTPELVHRWRKRCRYVNAYGPTETTILSSAWTAERSDQGLRALSIGRPISNTRMYVVDALGQWCAPGITGEIWIGGDGVAQGYLKRPELNEQQFIDDPWMPGGRLYRTGDLGRWLADGCIEFVGRRDRQVKLRGFRIELNEIEHRMREHAQVREAVVLVRGTGAEQRLLAWVVPVESSGDLSATSQTLIPDIRAFMRQTMPDYMLPQAIMALDALPLTRNGKLDDKALPEPAEAIASADEVVQARTSTETRLAAIWCAVLKMDSTLIGVNSNFFELGGHSLLAMRVVSRVREDMGAEVDTAELFAKPVLADFALAIDAAGQNGLPAIQPVPRDGPLPLSHAQQRLWFISQMEGEAATYTVCGGLYLSGALDRAALRRALDRIVARHETLRTTFESVDGQPVQHIAAASPFSLTQHDHWGLDFAGEHLAQLVQEESTPIDLAAGPVIRGSLVRLNDGDHLLLLTMHHIAMDGWSLLLKELGALYGAYASGLEDPLPPLKVQYADYAAWQQQWLVGDTWRLQSEYWRQTLAGAPALLELPTDRPRPAQQDYSGDVLEVAFDADLSAKLKAVSRRQGTTLFMALLTAWSVVLSKLSGQRDVVIGSPVANRAQVETEALIGFFVNPLALRVDLSDEPTLGELLQSVKRQVLAAQRHQQLPFEQVVEIVQPPRSMAHTPVFQVMLNWQDQDFGDLPFGGLQTRPWRPPHVMSKYDLTLDLGEAGDVIQGGFEYATALFDAATIQRQAGYLRAVIEAMVADLAQPVASLDLLGDVEHRLLQAFNDTCEPVLYERSWVDLFDQQAARTPERTAVHCGDAQLSYRELHERATRLAQTLVARGAGPGQVIALLDERGIDLLVMIVAVLKAGAAYVPLDPTHPSQRWLEILQEAQPLLLWVGNGLTDDDTRWLRHEWPSDSVLDTTELLNQLGTEANVPLKQPSLDDLAYVLFTSGSTGKPKGVMIEHRGMVNNMLAKVKPLGLSADDVIAQTASQCFDISVWQFLTALLLGGKVLIVGNDLTRDPQALLAHLDAQGATIWEPVPSVIQAALPCHQALPKLRWVLPTGEALSRELVARWFAQYPGIPLMNAYGPAECSDDVAFEPIHGPVERVLIGKPVANAHLHVVDEHLMRVPLGAVGELAISGAVVGRGYLGRPQETQAAFRANPYASHERDARLYLTGDLARRWPDGRLEYVGRKDFQVKVRGFRIELGEIESCLAQHAAVREAVVVARELGEGERQLVAYVTLHDQGHGDKADGSSINEAIQQHLRQRLPGYMVPAAIVVLQALPLSANGKIDRKALPAPLLAANDGAFLPPRTATELALASIWAVVLQLAPAHIGAASDFFAIGGHSLLAMRVIARIRDELGSDVSVGELFANPVLADLAKAVDQAARHVLPPIEPISRDLPLRLSDAQQRLWFLAQMDGVSATYTVPGALRLQGRLDSVALRRALDRIVARHETLRTTFDTVAGEPIQRIAPAAAFALNLHDVSALADADQRLVQLMDEEATAPFDLKTGPLIRGSLIRLSEDVHVLQLTMHHIVTDAWSLSLLLQELGQIYGAYVSGRDDPLPPLSIQYADYAAWQRQWVTGALWQSQRDHWRQALAGAPSLLELPTDRARPAQQDYTGNVVELAFDADLTAQLKALSRSQGTTLFVTWLTAWSVVLSKLSGQQDLVIGSPVANRNQLETEPLVGFFINLLALRIDLSGNPTLGELLQSVRRQVLAAQRHQQLPFEQVVEIVQPPRSLAHTPLFQVMLNWQDMDAASFALEGLQASPMRPPHTLSKYDLTLDLGEAGDVIQGGFEYATALFDAETIQRQAGYLRAVIEAMVADLAQPVASLDLLGDAEHRLLQTFNDTSEPALYERSWVDLFDQQAARTPERTAVHCGDAQLNYRELHERATRLAQALVARGAGPGQVIALLDERGIDLLVMIVAVLKAGAAYVPLDPTHPSQRWLDILDEATPLLLWVGEGLSTELRWLRRKWEGGEVCSMAGLLAQPDGTPPQPLKPPSLDELAYVLFTSGSTGKPKGVMIEHRGMVNNMLAKFKPLGLSADDVIAQTASQCFDISVWQFLTALLLGGKVLIVGNDLTRDPQALLAHLDAQGATIWEPVPSVMQAALPCRQALPKLRWVLPTGEALSRELVARWFAQYPGIPLMNAYGPAECSDDVAFEPIHGPVERVLIGKPVANAHLHVVDEHLMRVPLGAVGELAISGAVVGRGYLGRPQETQAAFRANPYASHERDARLYLTGDLARRWPDGRLEYVGRKDFQVKVRGFRIELGEIESCLAQHAAVREAVVVARELGEGERQLVAYVTLHDQDQDEDHKAGGSSINEAIQQHLRQRLPGYMVPAAIVVLQALPLNANGKIDRKALPDAASVPLPHTDYDAPRTDTEQAIATLWQEMLRVPRVGRGDNYFDLGGSSLLLIRMIGRLKEQGFALGVTDVFQLRSVAACAEAIDAQKQDDSALTQIGSKTPVTEIDEALVMRSMRAQCKAWLEGIARACAHPAAKPTLKLSPLQHMLLAWRHRDNLDVIALEGRHEPEALRQAFAAAAAEQDLLRAIPDPDQADQTSWRLLSDADVRAMSIPFVDLRGARDPSHVATLIEALNHELRSTLADSPLAYAAAIVSLSDVDHRLLMAVDHLVWDGMSASVMQRRMQDRLRGVSTCLRRSYQDYVDATWQPLSEQGAALLRSSIDRIDLMKTMAATRQALSKRAHLPLQVISMQWPWDTSEAGGTNDNSEPADLAFACFQRCVAHLTRLSRYGIVLNHHGREFGGQGWFDHVGLFLDKVPFAVDASNTLAPLAARADALQKQGIHHVGLALAQPQEWSATVPPLTEEVLFNFQADGPEAQEEPEAPQAASSMLDRLQDFRGILFEGSVEDGVVRMHCVFRGNTDEVDKLRSIAMNMAPSPISSPSCEPRPTPQAVPQAVPTEHALEVQDVRKRYGDFEAVRGISFSVRKGSCFGILGPNGAGKTSLLAMIEGLVPITSGAIKLLGMDVGSQIERIQPHLGVQLQQNNYFQFLTVAQLLKFYQELRSAVGGQRKGRSVQSLLGRLDLQDKLNFKVDELSGGQKQRLSIAIALLEDPDVIFLDEPTSALDPHSRIATWKFIEELRQDPGKTIILTTHYMEEAERLCDEILLMDLGKVIAQGTPAELVGSLGAHHLIQVQFGHGQFKPGLLQGIPEVEHAQWDERTSSLRLRTGRVAETLRELLDLSRAACIDVVNFDINRPTLEDVFLLHTSKELPL